MTYNWLKKNNRTLNHFISSFVCSVSVTGRLNLSGISEASLPGDKRDKMSMNRSKALDLDVTIANQLDINTKNKEIKRL